MLASSSFTNYSVIGNVVAAIVSMFSCMENPRNTLYITVETLVRDSIDKYRQLY